MSLKTNRKTAFFIRVLEKLKFLTHRPNPFQQSHRDYCGLNCVPQILMVQSVLPPWPQNASLFGDSLYTAVPVRMKSVGCFRIQKDSCLYKEGKFGDRRRGRVPRGDWTYSATNQGTPRTAGKPPEVGTHGTDPSSQLSRKQPCKPSISYL